MAGFDLELDENGDYIQDGTGFFKSNLTAGSAVRHQILGEFETWVGDLQAGRIQRGVSGRNASEAEADLERDSLIKALRQLEIAGLIDMIEVTVSKASATRFQVNVRTRDTQSGGTISIGQIVDFGP